jgi:hypothetical protein
MRTSCGRKANERSEPCRIQGYVCNVKIAALAALIASRFLAGCAVPASERPVTAYEGARLILGDGRVIDKGRLIVEGSKITQAGPIADIRVPAQSA